ADRLVRVGGDVTVDTRIDPILPRNAIVARAAWENLNFVNARDVDRSDVDLRGYVGLVGQTVLAIRGQREDANHPLPAYLPPLLGGVDTVRGLKFCAFRGHTLGGRSADLRVPVSSPLDAAKVGFSAFFDTAASY